MSGQAKDEKRCFTLEGARALLPDIRARTERARAELEALDEARSAASGSAERGDELERKKQAVLSHWVRSMEALGVEVEGPWRVDFDNGGGYYCWSFPEPGLDYVHGYDEDFAERVRIQ